MNIGALSRFDPLYSVLDDINRSIDAKLYYPALLVALTVPEICSALTLDKAVFVKEKHYVAFVDKYTTPQTLGCSGQDCYRLRGGVVHRANMAGHPNFGATHVIFCVPGTQFSGHAFTIDHQHAGKQAAIFDLVEFCNTMIAAARAWYDENHTSPVVSENMKNLIRYLPNGISPFIVGQPLVASGPS